MRKQRIKNYILITAQSLLFFSCTDFEFKIRPSRVEDHVSYLYDSEKEAVKSAERVNLTQYFLLALEYSEKGNSAKAIEYFKEVIKLDPKSARVKYFYARELYKSGMAKDAILNIKESLQMDPKSREANLLYADMLYRAKRFEEAKTIYLSVSKEDPSDEEISIYLALLDMEMNHFQSAQKRLLDFAKNNPDAWRSNYYLGKLAEETNQNKVAITYYKKALKIEENSPLIGASLAEVYEKEGLLEDSIALYRWLAFETDGAQYHEKLGQLYLTQKKYEEALKSFENLARKDPALTNNSIRLGILYIEFKQFEKAKVLFEKVLKKNKDSENVRFYLGLALENLKEYKAAVKEYKKIKPEADLFYEALYRGTFILSTKLSKKRDAFEWAEDSVRLHKDKTEYYELLARLFDSNQERKKAYSVVDEGLKLFPSDIKLLYYKGTLLEKDSKFEESVSIMLNVLRLDSQHVGALNFVGYLWAEQGKNLKEAEKYIRKALTYKKDDPFIMDSLGWVLFKQKRTREALELIKKAFEAQPNESVLADHLGDVHYQLNNLQDAMKYYELALKLGPEKESDRLKILEKIKKFSVECKDSEGKPCNPGSITPRHPGSE